ncbi:MAG: SgcJ/EcaC family oxidoreductase, partial [Dehalococcoidia bacterium]
MTERPSSVVTEQPGDGAAVRSLYQSLLDSWNARSADRFAALFDEDGYTIGFDGSLMHGRTEIAAELGRIFADHPTAAYVGKPKLVRLLTPETAVLRAVAGMVPPSRLDINPAVNTMQSLVTTKRDGAWRIAVYQNTPAQFHGRPE